MALRSLARGTSVSGHKIVVLLLPWRHISGDLSREDLVALLLERVLILGLLLESVILGVILLVLVEHLWIVGQVLLIRSPGLVSLTWGVVGILVIEVSGTDVVVVDSVLNVLEVLVSDWHTNFSKLVNHLVLWVHSDVLQVVILAIDDFAEGLLGLLGVDLGELLELLLVLGHEVLLLLG